MNSLLQLEIPKRSTQCALKSERLLPGMEIYSLLIEEQETSRLCRRDFCLSCWSQVRTDNSIISASRGSWKSKIEKRKVFEGASRTDKALVLLRTLQQDPRLKEAEIFVLCLLLARARRLILRQEFQHEGSHYHLYEISHQDEFITIKAVNLSDLQIETLQKSLADQLQAIES